MECFIIKTIMMSSEMAKEFVRTRKGGRQPILVAPRGREDYLVLCADKHIQEFIRFLRRHHVTTYNSSTQLPPNFPLGQQLQEVTDFVTSFTPRKKLRIRR